MKVKDQKLFRQQCYIDGQWVDADGGETIAVDNPATGEKLGTAPRMGAVETRRAIDAADRALPSWRAMTGKERSAILRRWADLMMANQEDLAVLMTAEQGKPLAEIEGRNRLCRLVHRMVRRRGQAGLRRHDPGAPEGQADCGAEAADRRDGGDHAVELPLRDDHPQGRSGAGGGLHHGDQARRARRRSRRWRWRSSPSAPGCRRACSTSSPAPPRADRRRN